MVGRELTDASCLMRSCAGMVMTVKEARQTPQGETRVLFASSRSSFASHATCSVQQTTCSHVEPGFALLRFASQLAVSILLIASPPTELLGLTL